MVVPLLKLPQEPDAASTFLPTESSASYSSPLSAAESLGTLGPNHERRKEGTHLEMTRRPGQPTLSPHTKRLAAIIYYDKYNKEKEDERLPGIEKDANQMCDLLEKSFNYQILSDDPNPKVNLWTRKKTIKPLENEGKLVPTFRMRLDKWKKAAKKGTVVESFLIYFHGHGTQVVNSQCLLTSKMTAIPFDELVNEVLDVDIHVNNFYLVLDCCSDHDYIATDTAIQRVTKAAGMDMDIEFVDKKTTICAAPPGHPATALEGKTLTSAILPILEEAVKCGHHGVPLSSLQQLLRDKQHSQGSENYPTVQHPDVLKEKLFPL